MAGTPHQRRQLQWAQNTKENKMRREEERSYKSIRSK